jgi:hypothetical protein
LPTMAQTAEIHAKNIAMLLFGKIGIYIAENY